VVEGVVTGDFQNGDNDDQANLGGFFLQQEVPDDDPATSEGVFVFDGDNPGQDVFFGQTVRVEGTVTEFFGETQIVAASVSLTGTASFGRTEIDLPVATIQNSDGELIADLERFEGMFVGLEEPAYVSGLANLERYGEILLSGGDRLRQFTNANAPDVAAYARHLGDIAGRSLILDDGLNLQNPVPNRYLSAMASNAADYTVRIGDTVAIAVGNIRFSRASGSNGAEAYRLVPTLEPLFVSRNPRPAAPPDPGGSVKVASFNVLNYFTTIDTGQDICGPSGNAGCRGADSSLELDRQREKTISALLALDADIVGLMELENNGGASLRSIVDGLNAETGPGSWAFVDTGFIGADTIAVGLIYRPSAVAPAGNHAILSAGVDVRFNDQKNRPTLAQSFNVAATASRFTVAVNHLKSKGSDCGDVGDPDLNDGQGNCNVTRTDAVLAMIDWLASDPTASGDPDVLVIGDLNAYLEEDPVTAFENAGFVNLLGNALGPNAYSFVFAGQAGALDHAFASPTFAPQISGVAEWHINADEAPLFDYNLEFGRDAGLFDTGTPFRASDHDPLIIGINP